MECVDSPFPFRCSLTAKDIEVLNLLMLGFSNQAIAHQLRITERSVKARFGRLFYKFGIRSGSPRIILAQYWSWPIFRIGAGYEAAIPAPHFAADVIERDRVRAQESLREIAHAAD